jgi:hypothetical protein
MACWTIDFVSDQFFVGRRFELRQLSLRVFGERDGPEPERDRRRRGNGADQNIAQLSRQLNYRIVRRDRRVIPGVIKRSVIAEWAVSLRIAIGLQHQIPNLYPGKIVFSESVGYRFQSPVLCRQESAPAITAISFAPRFNHAFLRLDSDRVATDFITSVLFNQRSLSKDILKVLETKV